MIRMTNYVMLYAPIGVFGLISYTVTKHGLAVLLPLGKLILLRIYRYCNFCRYYLLAFGQVDRHEHFKILKRGF